MRLIAVSLIGIPAVGKTYFANELLKFSKLGSLKAGVLVISFDDYIKIDFSKPDELENGIYKKSREKLLEDVERLIQNLSESDTNQWNQILSSNQDLRINQRKFHVMQNSPLLIILDDNNYFRSMRQRIRAICRNYQCHHFQVYLKSSLNEAIQRNLKRSNPVPQAIIEKMFKNIEAPVNLRTIFIENSLITEEVIEKLHDRIENPEKEPVEELKTPQNQSLIHEADLITRKQLTARIKSFKGSKEISQTCEILNRKRKEFLEELRKQNLIFSDEESMRAAFNCYLDK